MMKLIATIEDCLGKVDEFTFKQFEKITQFSYQHFGWDKYKLMEVSLGLSGLALGGFGTYESILALTVNAPLLLPFSLTTMAFGAVYTKAARYDADYQRTEDLKLLKSGLLEARKVDLVRATQMAVGVPLVIEGIYGLSEDHFFFLPEFQEQSLASLTALTLGLYFSFLSANQYFANQNPTPPERKPALQNASSLEKVVS